MSTDVYRSQGATSRDTATESQGSQGGRTLDSLGKHPEKFSPPARNRGRFVAGDEAQRFWSKVQAAGECWLWTGGATSDGYGRFRTRTGEVRAHRYAWQLLVGPIPEDHTVDHLIGPGEPCTSTLCVRAPDHLEPVTNTENLRRRHARRRTRTTTGPVRDQPDTTGETTPGPVLRTAAPDHGQPNSPRHGPGPVRGQRAAGTPGQDQPARPAPDVVPADTGPARPTVPAAASGTTSHAGPVPARHTCSDLGPACPALDEARPRRCSAEASE